MKLNSSHFADELPSASQPVASLVEPGVIQTPYEEFVSQMNSLFNLKH